MAWPDDGSNGSVGGGLFEVKSEKKPDSFSSELAAARR